MTLQEASTSPEIGIIIFSCRIHTLYKVNDSQVYKLKLCSHNVTRTHTHSVHTLTHIHKHTHMHTQLHTRTHTHAHTHSVHTHVHTCTRTHTHTDAAADTCTRWVCIHDTLICTCTTYRHVRQLSKETATFFVWGLQIETTKLQSVLVVLNNYWKHVYARPLSNTK